MSTSAEPERLEAADAEKFRRRWSGSSSQGYGMYAASGGRGSCRAASLARNAARQEPRPPTGASPSQQGNRMYRSCRGDACVAATRSVDLREIRGCAATATQASPLHAIPLAFPMGALFFQV